MLCASIWKTNFLILLAGARQMIFLVDNLKVAAGSLRLCWLLWTLENPGTGSVYPPLPSPSLCCSRRNHITQPTPSSLTTPFPLKTRGDSFGCVKLTHGGWGPTTMFGPQLYQPSLSGVSEGPTQRCIMGGFPGGDCSREAGELFWGWVLKVTWEVTSILQHCTVEFFVSRSFTQKWPRYPSAWKKDFTLFNFSIEGIKDNFSSKIIGTRIT